jgi:hypothetical protein
MDVMTSLAFVTALTGHGLLVSVVSLVGGGVIAYRFSERWQRWRQRRDFQYRTMTTLASAGADTVRVLYELMFAQSHVDPKRHQELLREYPIKLLPLLALDADFFATFEDDSLGPDLDYLTGVMGAAHKALAASGPIPVEHVRAILKCATAQRRLMIVKMSGEMDLARATDSLRHDLERRARALPAGVTVQRAHD